MVLFSRIAELDTILPGLLMALPLAYAEIHYTLKGFSLVFRRRPEILADAPWRVEPGHAVPLAVLVRDADRFPVRIEKISALFRHPDGTSESVDLIRSPLNVDSPWWHKIWKIRPERSVSGPVRISVRFQAVYLRTGKKHRFSTDNLWSSSHKPLQVFMAEESLPAFKHWIHGDLHYHSSMTSDQVEYGAPMEIAAPMAKALGLRFMGVTDHSYDLDDFEHNYLENDPGLKKWHSMLRKTEQMEKETGLVMLPGEEVSCGNHRNENIHLLVLNHTTYFPGSGDSNERWFKNLPDLGIGEVLDRLDSGAAAFAAHPGVPFSPLQRILLRRGTWHDAEYSHPGLHGLQIYNGAGDRSLRRGRQAWIRQLLGGRRPVLIAGNDAHGCFNRNRKLGQPFLYVSENRAHTFGRGRTVICLPETPCRENIMSALRQGRSCITTGPVMDITVIPESGHAAGIGETAEGSRFTCLITAKSSKEFGAVAGCSLFTGKTGDRKETLLKRIRWKDGRYEFSDRFEMDGRNRPNYIRGELTSRTGSRSCFCITNPVWIRHRERHDDL